MLNTQYLIMIEYVGIFVSNIYISFQVRGGRNYHRYLRWSCLGLATMMFAGFDAKSCKSKIDVTHARRRVDAIVIKSRIHGREDKRNNSGGENKKKAKT